jgi:hypothetical protein
MAINTMIAQFLTMRFLSVTRCQVDAAVAPFVLRLRVLEGLTGYKLPTGRRNWLMGLKHKTVSLAQQVLLQQQLSVPAASQICTTECFPPHSSTCNRCTL